MKKETWKSGPCGDTLRPIACWHPWCLSPVQGVELYRRLFYKYTCEILQWRKKPEKTWSYKGSYFTQLIGSIADYIMIDYAVQTCKSSVRDILVLEDDSLVATTGEVELPEMALAIRGFGMSLNFKKLLTPNCIYDVKFLGYQVRNEFRLSPLRNSGRL